MSQLDEQKKALLDKQKAVKMKDPYKEPVTLIDFMAGIAFLGYAVNKFENIHVPEGSTLGEEVGYESYRWAQSMCKARADSFL
jgi:hypothetical protein